MPLSDRAIMERCFALNTRWGQVTILDEPTYAFGSADNARTYDAEIRLDRENQSSIHGVRIEGKWTAVFGAGGGCSTVHQHTAIELSGRLYVAVGDQIVCLNLVTCSMDWSRRVDPATCFGVYWDSAHEALISHGELQISRISLTGDEIWSSSGADIFSEGFRCLPEAIEVIDFNHSVYLFDYASGELRVS